MLALIASVLFVIAGFDGHVGRVSSFDFLAFGLAVLALHLVYPVAIPGRRR